MKNFIAEHGMFEGFTGNDSPGYAEICAIGDISQKTKQLNRRVRARLPRICRNGNGEVLAFDAVGGVDMIPLIGMDAAEAIKIAESFAEFAETFELDAE